MNLVRALCAGVMALVTLGAGYAALADASPDCRRRIFQGTTDELVARIMLGRWLKCPECHSISKAAPEAMAQSASKCSSKLNLTVKHCC